FVHEVERTVAHQAGDRQRQLAPHAPLFHHHDAAADLGQPADAEGHVRIVDAENDDVVGVVGDSRGEGSPLQADVGGEAQPDPAAGVVALDDRDLHQVAGGIGGDLAVPHVRLHLLHTGQKLARDDANDADQATASVDPE